MANSWFSLAGWVLTLSWFTVPTALRSEPVVVLVAILIAGAADVFTLLSAGALTSGVSDLSATLSVLGALFSADTLLSVFEVTFWTESAASLELFSFFWLFLKVTTLDVSEIWSLLIVVAVVSDTVSALVLTILKLELSITPKIVAPIKTDAVSPETF